MMNMPMKKFQVGGIEVVYVSSPLPMRMSHYFPIVVGGIMQATTTIIIEGFNNHSNSCHHPME